MPGARCTRSLACEFKKHTSGVTTGPDGFNRHSPRNGFNGLFRALPGERILVVTVAHGLRLIKPGRADFASVNLAPATGVGTTRFCRPHERRSSRALQIAHKLDSPCDCRYAPGALASTASRPAFVTTRDPPLLSRRDSAG
jgi:hypothetical protein